MGGAFGNNGKLVKPLKSFVNGNVIFEYDTKLSPLDAPYVAKKFSHKPWCLNRGEYLMLQKSLEGKWVVVYRIEVSTPYGIDEDTVAIYGFISHTNH